MLRFLLIALSLLLSLPALSPAQTYGTCSSNCTRYAGPAGGGTTCTAGDPCTLGYVGSVSAPGDNNCLLDGTYQGADQMLWMRVDDGDASGTAGNPISFCAVNDGAVTIDGEDVNNRYPIWISGDIDYIVIEGVNAQDAGADDTIINVGDDNCVGQPIETCRPDFLTLRRVGCIGYNTVRRNFNNGCLNFDTGEGHLIEDMFCVGIHRKCLSPVFRTLGSTIRRAIIDAEGQDWDSGPIFGITIGYHGFETRIENTICHWTNSEQTGAVAGNCFGSDSVSQYDDFAYSPPERIFGEVTDVTIGSAEVDHVLDASIAFTHNTYYDATASNDIDYGIRIGDPGSIVDNPDGAAWNGMRLSSNIAFLDTEANGNIPLGTRLHNGANPDDNEITNSVNIGDTANDINVGWVSTNNNDYATVAAFIAAEPDSIYGSREHCYRTVDGTYTRIPLWPYPMAARMQAAQAAAGETDYNMNEVLWDIFGNPPAHCRRDANPQRTATFFG